MKPKKLFHQTAMESLRDLDIDMNNRDSIKKALEEIHEKYIELKYKYEDLKDSYQDNLFKRYNIDSDEKISKDGTFKEALLKNETQLNKDDSRATIIYSKTGDILFVNNKFCELLNYSEEEISKLKFSEIQFRDDTVIDEVQKGKIFKNKDKSCSIHKRFYKKGGDIVWVSSIITDVDDKYVEAVKDITLEKNNEKKIEEQHHFIKQVTETIPMVVLVTNIETREIVWCNDRVLEELGYGKKELLNQDVRTFETFIHKDDIKNFYNTILGIKDRVSSCEFRFNTKNEGWQWFYSRNVSFKKGKDNQIEEVMTVIQNITELKEAKKELIEARINAENANQAKSIFLRNVSHSIRTPLNVIQGFTELLENSVKTDKERYYVETIKNSENSLLTLLDDIIDISKVEADKVIVNKVATDVVKLMGELKNIFSLQVEDKELKLDINIEENFERYLIIDNLRVKQILYNLIDNSLKFTDDGGIYLSLSQEKIDNNTINLIIDIKDSGCGIKKEVVENIFKPYKQGKKSFDDISNGVGLGLTIAKKFVNIMEGDLFLKETSENGTTFRLKIDNVDITKRSAIEEIKSSKQLEIKFKPAKVLVVEDLDMNRELLKEYLEDSNLTILEAASGEEGIDIAKKYNPELILMDIVMSPGMDGYKACKKIRDMEDLSSTPIVALTALAVDNTEAKMAKQGFNGFLVKPISKNKLLETMVKYLSVEE